MKFDDRIAREEWIIQKARMLELTSVTNPNWTH